MKELIAKINKIIAEHDKLPLYKPEKGESYLYINSMNFTNNSLGLCRREWTGDKTDQYLYKCGNVFKTPMDAKKHVPMFFFRAFKERFGVYNTLLPDEKDNFELDELINQLAQQEADEREETISGFNHSHIYGGALNLEDCFKLFKAELAKRMMLYIDNTITPEEVSTIRGIKISLEVMQDDEFILN